MIPVLEGCVLAVLGSLDILLQLHLGVEQAVLMDVLLVLNLSLVRQLGKVLLMLLFQLGYPTLVILLGLSLLLHAAGGYGLVILVKVRLNIPFRIGHQLVHLSLVLGLHGFCLL